MADLHHLDVGCADASIIIGDATLLVDCHGIAEYPHLLPASKVVRGVFITHQHSDHYSGLAFLRDKEYHIENLIYSPYERSQEDNSVTGEEWEEFEDLRSYFEEHGTKCYRPYRQEILAKPWWETGGVKFWMLGPSKYTATSDTREIHDACLVVKASMNARSCLFTGDASDTNLQDVATIDHICDDILHASHHGSINGADLGFIKKCNPQYTVISTQPGVHESVPHPTALKRYQEHTAKKVYRTDIDHSLKWTF